ncbi:MAG: hypothetical protein M3527_04465 [Actinomycetota bacterium]|nr:hypothetical protein [Acidimicrobiia bacterium]MDQ3293687.1 hypothetical protein [Actinomycetota bacterium]
MSAGPPAGARLFAMRNRAAAFLLAGSFLVACGGDGDEGGSATTETSESTTTTEEGSTTTTDESTRTTEEETTTTEGSSGGEFEEFVVEGEFSIGLPGEPELNTQEAPSDFGPIEVDIYFVEGPEASVAIAVNALPADRLASAEPQVILGDTVAGAAGSTGGTVVTEAEVPGEEFPSRDAEITVTAQGQEALVLLRAVIVGDRLFQMQSLGLVADRAAIEDAFEQLVSSFEPVT